MAMTTLNLGGSWTVRNKGDKKSIDAAVPGDVVHDLLRAKAIPDPFVRDNEAQVQWIGESDWIYERSFDVPARLLEQDRVLLRCKGLDTSAIVRINGKMIGQADNMFRTWEFDAKKAVKAGTNTISVEFESAVKYIEKQKRKDRSDMPEWGSDHKVGGAGWIRKEQCNFGWDWGIRLVTCGIWRDIELVAFSGARLDEVHVRQKHSKNLVRLDVNLSAEATGSGALRAAIALSRKGRAVAETEVPLRRGSGKASLNVKNPELWWPNNMGDQPLYDLSVTLFDADGKALDTWERRIGLRTLRLDRHKDKWGESFQFEVNGVPFFSKGANWIPGDGVLTRMSQKDYARLVKDAADANMNMLRVWGGGLYEEDCFYELCDELGLCVWQDFMFACSTYPAFDKAFLDNCEKEFEDNVRRLRHHACIALWCGNNELEQGLVGPKWNSRQMSWKDYGKIFDKMLPAVVKRLDPDRDYWPCSPHTPGKNREDYNNPDRGDAHLWSVWHGKQPFEWYRTCMHRFNSEFGFQSFPEPKTVAAYTDPRDRNVTSYIMEWHQRSGIGNSTILHYMTDWFRMPTSFDATLWLSQIQQGMAIKYAVEHWRRQMPRGMGTLYWQINDTWPVASWASIDYFGRWKALHYMARHFYAPLILSAVEDISKGTVELHVTSDRLDAATGTVEWVLLTAAGKKVATGKKAIGIPAQKNQCVETLRLQKYLDKHGPRDLVLAMRLREGRTIVSSNLVTFCRPKHLELEKPALRLDIKAAGRDGKAFRVGVKSDKPALWAWLEMEKGDARYSDNFFHLVPGETVTVTVTPARKTTAAALKKSLRIQSLYDTSA